MQSRDDPRLGVLALLGGYDDSGYSYFMPPNVHSAVYENVRQVKSGRTLLFGFTVYNSGPAQWIQWFDQQRAPATGNIPAGILSIPTVDTRGAAWVPPRVFLGGCWIVNSTTGPTYTAGAADCYFDVQFL